MSNRVFYDRESGKIQRVITAKFADYNGDFIEVDCDVNLRDHKVDVENKRLIFDPQQPRNIVTMAAKLVRK